MSWLRQLLAALGASFRVTTPVAELRIEAKKLDDFLKRSTEARDDAISRVGETRGSIEAQEVIVEQLRREANHATKVAEHFRGQLDAYGAVRGQPYGTSLHLSLQVVIAVVEYGAGFVAFQTGLPEATEQEALVLPLGLVFGLVLSGHSFGVLMKYLHVAYYVNAIGKRDEVRLPAPEIFGLGSTRLLTITTIAGSGLIAAITASLLVRWDAELPVSPWTFMLVGVGLAAASCAEAFIWTNPWTHLGDEIERLDEGTSDNLADALEELEDTRASLQQARLELSELYPRVELQREQLRRELLTRSDFPTPRSSAEALAASMELHDRFAQRFPDLFLAPSIDTTSSETASD